MSFAGFIPRDLKNLVAVIKGILKNNFSNFLEYRNTINFLIRSSLVLFLNLKGNAFNVSSSMMLMSILYRCHLSC